MINKIQSNDLSFKGARVNILATADNHGNIMRLPRVLKTIENNAKDIFPKAESPSTLNIFAIVGDWFINPSKKGFITHPQLTNGDLQNAALLKVIDSTNAIVLKLIQKALKVTKNSITSFDPLGNKTLSTIMTPGNHDLDAGADFFINVMKKNPMKTLVTNADIEKSPKLEDVMNSNPNIVKSLEYSVPDDKRADLFHKVLFVSATIPSMDFYNPGLCEGLEFYDNCNKKDANLTEADIGGTINSIKKEVDEFKSKNPKGAVILLSHMGGRLSEIIRDNVPQINHILNGHDHKNVQSNVGKTSVNSLGKDNEMIKSLNFEFDDEGNFVKATMSPYFTATTLADGLENNPFQLFLNELLDRDMKPLVSLGELKSEKAEDEAAKKFQKVYDSVIAGLGITTDIKEKLLLNDNFKALISRETAKIIEKMESTDKPLDKLTYGNEIRYQNSYLMNYLTSAIKRIIREKHDANIFTVALQSSIVRGGLSDGADNLAVMKVFDGVSEDLSDLKIGNVTGAELVGLITENVLSNLKAPTRNTIIHWSDVQVNRALIEAINAGKVNCDYSDAVRVRNKFTKQFEPIDLTENYKMVIGEKFLVKDDIKWPGRIRDKFVSLGKTYDELFREYISSVDYKLHITPKTKETRIIDKID